jgi:SAM-dependent methyltransferase
MDEGLRSTLEAVARFYDERKVGDVGPLGFRRSTDLRTLLACLPALLREGILSPGETRFLDLGCADGRVNVFLSYFAKISVGIEMDEWTLDEYGPLKDRLQQVLGKQKLPPPPDNIVVFHGDSTEDSLQKEILSRSGVAFEDFDLFYTYLVMHEEFADLIAREAKRDAVFLVYGVDKVLPRYEGLRRIDPLSPIGGILGVYIKE